MQMNQFPITLVESFMISPNVKHFIFQSKLTPAFNYAPGQFITIHFQKEGKDLKRSYSVANAPEQNNRIEFAAGYVKDGPGTELLFNLNPGDEITISGPFGRLILKEEDPKRYLLVATSTGVTPYRAMLDDLSRRLNKNPLLAVVILQGVQKSEDILYIDDFMAFSQKYPQVVFKACLSRELEEHPEKNEYCGYVQTAFSQLNLNPEQDMVYLCGNPGMIDDAFELLKNQGFTTQQVVREKYLSR